MRAAAVIRVTLEQWRMLQAVVDAGGFARAAERVHKSPSSINHAVQKLEEQLGVDVFEVQGRKAVLTPAGKALLRRAEHLLEEAAEIEALAGALAAGVESEIRLAVDQLLPRAPVIGALEAFSRAYPATRIQLHEVVLSGGPDLLRDAAVDILLGPELPSGYLGSCLGELSMVCVAHPSHPLAQAEMLLTRRHLQGHRQVVVRDSGIQAPGEGGWVEADQRWTVSHMGTACEILRSGIGFAWMPEDRIAEDLAAGRLVELNLEAGTRHQVPFYIVHADRDRAGVASQSLMEALEQAFRADPAS
ncbi:LysR family transcriptional regulator [Thioalkalivibrio sp. ALJ7]|uniref:LysR family transcriptional regulator n=1 Tax=Thioalkalivibrio sp. ALJ7 TaxID=1158756 RepID=UPI000378D7C6|nr:LysR family transcriptional regulator [Thioalkalivibrio sp. ALJ7]